MFLDLVSLQNNLLYIHIGDFKEMIALVASPSHIILYSISPIPFVVYILLSIIISPTLLGVLYASTCVGEESPLKRCCSGSGCLAAVH